MEQNLGKGAMPDSNTLRKALELEWQDHFQTRNQTWKTLQVSVVMLAVLVIAGLRVESPWLTTAIGLLTVFVNLSGAAVTWHHRKTQSRKFTHIDRLEEALGLHSPGLLDDVHPPRPMRGTDVIDFRRMNTPLFVFRMHLAILVCAAVFTACRWFGG